MAASSLKPALLVAALAVLAAPPGALRAAAAAVTASREPIQLDAQSSELDYGNNQLLFRKVKISQGPMSIAADTAHATGLDFENSHWVFQGAVHIVMQQGQLAADEADVSFEQKLLQRALITGKPSTFEQRDTVAGKHVQGHADSIEYDVGKGVIHFLHNAWLSDGQNEIRGESLKYIVLERRMIADAADQNAQRVHITITPPPAAPGKP
jgi:lipopolysaccharide transport protein LptA